MSSEFAYWFNRYSSFKHVGRVNRVVKFRAKKGADVYFGEFMHAHYPAVAFNAYSLTHLNKDSAYASLTKYDKAEYDFDANAWAFAWARVDAMFTPFVQNTRMAGMDEVITNLNMRSSSGFPYNLCWRSKKQFFEWSGAKAECERIERSYHTTDPIRALWTNNPKEEILPKLKILNNKFRTFLSPDVPHVVTHNMLFLMQNSAICESHLKHFSFVGGSKFYGGWNRIFRILDRLPNKFMFDASTWDANLSSRLLWRVCDLRFSWLPQSEQTTENYLRFYNAYYDIVNSLIVCTNGEMLEKRLGNPSGSVNTIIDNTLILAFLVFYVWYEMAPDERKNDTLSEILEDLSCVLQGDDDTCSVSDRIVSWYNPFTFQAVSATVGIVIKVTHDGRPLTWDETEFCSSYFHQLNNGFVVPFPEATKILSAMALKTKHMKSVKLSLCRANALRIEAFYVPEVYDILTDYARYLVQSKYDELMMPTGPEDAGISGQEALSTCHSTRVIQAIYISPQDYIAPADLIHDWDWS